MIALHGIFSDFSTSLLIVFFTVELVTGLPATVSTMYTTQTTPAFPELLSVRVMRNESGPDRFSSTKLTTCRSLDYCSKAKATLVDGARECLCQCPADLPIFQDDVGTCVAQIPESSECRFGALSDESRQEITPTVQLPPFGHSITRKINLTLSESNSDRQCAAVECHYLSTDGWSSFTSIRLGSQPPRLRLVPTQLPPVPQQQLLTVLPRPLDASNTTSIIYGLQWLGSSEHADFLQGRLILLTAICNATGLPPLSLCFPMRIAGTSGRVRSSALLEQQQQHEGDNIETGVLVAAACGGALGVLYVIVLAIFVTSRLRKRRKAQHADRQQQQGDGGDSGDEAGHENRACENSEAKSVAAALGNSEQAGAVLGYGSAPYSAWSQDFANRHRVAHQQQQQLQLPGLSPPHTPLRFLCTPPPFFLNDVLIVQTPDAMHRDTQLQDVIHQRAAHKTLPKPPLRRRKVFFDPAYLTAEQLKNPPDAAENFRAQIHCMVNITKSRLDRRKFLPHLEMIDEENSLRRSLNEALLYQQLAEGQVILDAFDARQQGNRDLDAVVLQVRSPDAREVATSTDDLKRPSDWSQILKDEWGSNESLAKVPLRRRIQEVFHGGSKQPTSPTTVEKPNSIVQKCILQLEKPKTKVQEGRVKAATSDDEESDKASSKSGTGSNPEKDSGIEDDVNSDKSIKNALPSHKSKVDAPVMISRKKIVSASAAIGVSTLLPVRVRTAGGGVHAPVLPAF